MCKLSGTRKWKFIDTMVVTLPRWLPCPYIVKTLQKSSSSEPVDWFPRNLVCRIDDSCPSYFVQMMTLGWAWPILRQGQIWKHRLIYRKKWKLLIFQNFCSLWPETNWDNEDMRVLKFKVIFWPWPKVIYIWKLKLAFLRNNWAILNQILFCAWPKYLVNTGPLALWF